MKLIFILCTFTSLLALADAQDAQNIVARIGAKNCDETAEGYNCFLTVSPRLVDIVIPKNYISSGQCLVHFHGLRFRDEDVDQRETIEWFTFEKGLEAASPKTLMIAPVGTFGQSNYSLASDYGSLSKLSALITAVENAIGENCTNITLSGHSAAYRVLTPLLAEINAKPSHILSTQVKAVFLFDALYSSNVDPFSEWLSHSTERFIYNVARSGAGTDENSDLIPAQKRYINLISQISDHWDLVRDRYFQEFLNDAATQDLTTKEPLP